MSHIDALLQEFNHEAATTRRMLERVPMDKRGWQPHPKSMTLGRLASHIAEIPFFVTAVLKHDELNFDRAAYKPANHETLDALLAEFDRLVAAAQEAMPGTTEECLRQSWRMRSGDQVIFELPRIGMLRTMVLSHMIHHRGQLSVYLRMQDVALPSVYGPTADEARF